MTDITAMLTKDEQGLLPCKCGSREILVTNIPAHSHVLADYMPDYQGGQFVECKKCGTACTGEDAWNQNVYADALRAMQETIERMAVALEFYHDGFLCYQPLKRFPELAWKPTEKLLDDCGNTAKDALTLSAPYRSKRV